MEHVWVSMKVPDGRKRSKRMFIIMWTVCDEGNYSCQT